MSSAVPLIADVTLGSMRRTEHVVALRVAAVRCVCDTQRVPAGSTRFGMDRAQEVVTFAALAHFVAGDSVAAPVAPLSVGRADRSAACGGFSRVRSTVPRLAHRTLGPMFRAQRLLTATLVTLRCVVRTNRIATR